jgi:uncharacterized membrane protein YfcA
MEILNTAAGFDANLVNLLFFITIIFLSIISALAGLGGGIFLIPLLILAFNMPVKFVAGTMLFAMVPYTAVASIQNVKNGYVNFKIGFYTLIGSTIGVYIGTLYSLLLPDLFLRISFIFVVAYMFLSLQKEFLDRANIVTELFNKINKVGPHISGKYGDDKISVPGLILFGLVAGIFSGLLGIGGGFLYVPLLIIGLRFPPKIAIGTSLFMIFITSSIGAFRHSLLEHILYHKAFILAIGMMVGGVIGTKMLKNISEKRLQKTVSIILIIAAIATIFR